MTGAGRSVAVTGIGIITAGGVGIGEFWRNLRGYRSPVSEVTRFDASPFRTRIAAEATAFDPESFMERTEARHLDRFGQLSLAAARQAIEDAKLDPSSVPGERVAVQMGSALGGIAHAEGEFMSFLTRGIRGVDPRLALTVFCGASSCNIAIAFGFQGPNSTNAMSCASGTIAVGDAFRLVRDGVVDVAIAGGVEAPLSPLTFGAFALIRAMSARNHDPAGACRPFDRERDGFVMGEGAAILVLEEEGHARARGARIYARVSGYGTTSDAHHMTAPRPDGSQAARAMSEALRSAGIAPTEVDYVNAHGSSTPLNDSTESMAIRAVFGEHTDRLLVSATKPYYGHALGASGAIEAAICAMTLSEGWIPPTLNLSEPGDGCDLPHVSGEGRAVRVRHALSNSFGFGGINACLLLSFVEAVG
ncbi:MAG: beta-ketoacyl-[acyl-carrier-protein] synthase family protein [Gemmatimonadetes bacterium]|nr:beta-ketoacyl-[acyl-carrier-protein] synthase family protein [Gemmatimonadota bacterium]